MGQPKLSNANGALKPLLSVGPFGGLDATTDPYYVDGTHLVDMLNIVPNREYQGYSSMRGRALITPAVPDPSFGNPVNALGFYYIAQPLPYMLAVVGGRMSYKLFGSANNWTVIKNLPTVGGATGSFVPYLNWDFYSDPSAGQVTGVSSNQIKIDNSFNVTNWQILPPFTAATVVGTASTGTNSTSTVIGAIGTIISISVPASTARVIGSSVFLTDGTNFVAGTVTSNRTGNIQTILITQASSVGATIATGATYSTGLIQSGVYYRYTYSNAAQESSPSPPTLVPTNSYQTPLFDTVTMNASTDASVTTINVYRIGGALGQWLLVGTVANPGSGTTTFIDNVPDSAVTGQNLILHRDPPPPFVAIAEHKERIFGFGYPSYTINGVVQPSAPCDLWYSNYVEPWGFDNTNQVLQLGAHDSGDIGVEIKSIGSILIAFKSKTTWVVYGESPNDLFPQKLFDIGATSKLAVVAALGVVFWLSNQGVYMFDGSTLTYISRDVKKILDGFSALDFETAAGMFSDRMYWLSFPLQGISLGYDTETKTWWKSNMVDAIYAYDPEAPTRPQSIDLVVGGTFVVGAATLEQWFCQEFDRGLPITSMIVSRIAGGESESIATMRVRYLELNASIGGSDSILVSINPNPGFPPPTFSQLFSQNTIPAQLISVTPGTQGQQLQLTISCTSNDGIQIQSCAAHGWIRRLYGVFG